MTPEQWQEVKKVLTGALERSPEERSVYLDQACTDPALRREVESLIAAHEHGDSSLLELPTLAGEPLQKGSQLGQYTILGPVGAGGMGEVYRARDARLNRDVAIKVLPLFLSDDPDRLRRFEQEARAAAALSHPNILSVFQMGTHESAPYLVSELLEGATLREQLRRGPMPLRKAIDYGVQIAHGLAAAHDKGIVHRDLKPENLFVTKDGRVKILDFGLAKLTQRAWALDSAAPTVNSMTEPGAVVGTVGYMSPEQVSGKAADHRADVFAFGAVLYEILTGKRAFQKPTSAETMSAILNEDPPGLSQLAPACPPGLQRVVQRCLEKHREQRFQSASDLAFALEALSDFSSTSAEANASPRSRRLWPWAAAVTLVVLALAMGGYFYFRRAPVLTEKDSIVLAEFTNTTGDPVFDGTLRQGLSVQLEQTPFLRLVSADQVAQTLRMMVKPPDTQLTHDVAREVCERAGATIEVEGSIAALGSQFVLGLNALDCRTGEMLAQEQKTAKSKDNVLAALTTAASGLRSKLGESQASLSRYDVPLSQATTSSLEALQAFSRGSAEFNSFRFPSAASQFERAVSLDRNFAVAYGVLGTTHAFLSESNLAAEDVKKAYALRDRVSEWEKMYLSANYDLWVTGDLERAVQASQVWTQTYPRDPRPCSGLTYVYRLLGRNDEALAAGLECIKLDATSAPAYTRPMAVYIRQGRLDQAEATLKEVEARHMNFPFPAVRYWIDFLRHDDAGMAQMADQLGPARFAFESPTAAYRGQLARSRDLTQRAIASAKQAHASEDVAVLEATSALTEALVGNLAEARSAATQASKPPASWDAQSNAALVLALAGEVPQAQEIAAELNRRLPEGTFVQFYYLPAIRAALALHQGKPDEAIESLRAVASYEMAANEVSSVSPAMIPVYIRGEAYLAAHQGAQAAGEFQKLLAHPGFVGNFLIGALAHLGLGRAYALSGDTVKAKTSYQDFFALWKDADLDIPILKQAKAEYAKLQ